MDTFINNNPTLALLIPGLVALMALILAGRLYFSLRQLRRGQTAVLGDGRDRDIVAHAHALQQRIDGLAYDIRQLSTRLEGETRRMDDCLTYRSMVRYDAYRDLSGMQSTSVVLLDAQFSGIIISAIQSRDHARIYVKDVRHGESREKLSPEEEQVLKEAMGLKTLKHHKAVGGGGAA